MTISKDLFLAILSMDSYNRGYGAGLSDGGLNDPDGLGETGHIGSAALITRADLGITTEQYQAWQDVGFYAIAYDMDGSGPSGLADKTVVPNQSSRAGLTPPLT